MWRSRGLAACAALLLSGCAEQLARASAAYEDAFVPLEEAGRFDYWRQKATPTALVKDGHPRSFVEIGRRFETGSGLPKDRDCAAWWYKRAYMTPYDEPQSTYSNGHVFSAGTLRRAGLPQARIAYRRLLKGGPVASLDFATARARCEAFGA